MFIFYSRTACVLNTNKSRILWVLAKWQASPSVVSALSLGNSGLRNFYIIYHWITSLLFFQGESSFGSNLIHKFVSSHCGLGKSQVQAETWNALKICQTFWIEMQSLAVEWVHMWWNDIVKIENFLENMYEVYKFQILKTIIYKKIYNDPYWTMAHC